MSDAFRRVYEFCATITEAGDAAAGIPELGDALPKRVIANAGVAKYAMEVGQFFRLEDEACHLLTGIIPQRGEAFAEMFDATPLPFPVSVVETKPDPGNTHLTLIISNRDAKTEVAMTFVVTQSAVLPPLSYVLFQNKSYQIHRSGFGDHAVISGGVKNPALLDELRHDQELTSHVSTSMMKAINLLQPHPGMVEIENTGVSAFPRAERRRAEREGRPLPEARVSTIRVGVFGHGHLQASEQPGREEMDRQKRRAHWVRGHFMRNPSGGLSWRMPHVRGVGPLVRQERRVIAASDSGPEP